MTILSKLCVGIVAMCAAVGILMRMLGWDELLKDREECDLLEPTKRTYITKLIKIPRKSIGTLVGRGGSTVHRIEFETKTFIRVIYDEEKNNLSQSGTENSAGDWLTELERKQEEEVSVEIRAENEKQIGLAALAIRGLVADSLEPRITKLKFIEKQALDDVLGIDERNIKRIQRRFRVRIQIDNEDKDLPCLSITGTKESVNFAEHRIDQLISLGCKSRSTNAEEDDLTLATVLSTMKELNKIEEQW